MKNQDYADYEGSESYQGSGELKSQQIILNLYNKALTEGSKEMTEEGTRTRLINGEPITVATPNQKEVFINSVEMSYFSLISHISKCKDKDLVNKFEQIKDKKSQIYDKYNEQMKSIKKPNWYDNDKVFENNNLISMSRRQLEDSLFQLHKEILIMITELLNYYKYFEEGGSDK